MNVEQINISFGEESEAHLEEMRQYLRHLKGDYDYTIPITPMPTPRARAVARRTYIGGQEKYIANVYNPSEYTTYKNQILKLIKKGELSIPRGNYGKIFATFYIPFPASTPQKRRIEGTPHEKKGDWDNFAKGLCDALQGEKSKGIDGVLIDDGTIHTGNIKKVYTNHPTGCIKFNLI